MVLGHDERLERRDCLILPVRALNLFLVGDTGANKLHNGRVAADAESEKTRNEFQNVKIVMVKNVR